MDLLTLVKNIDAGTARAFVKATRHVIDALLIEAERVRQVQTPAERNYDEADLSRAAPPGGWISHEELRDTARRLAEATAAEKWADGVVFAVRALNMVGAAL